MNKDLWTNEREIMHVILLVDGGNLRQHPNKVLPDNYITLIKYLTDHCIFFYSYYGFRL